MGKKSRRNKDKKKRIVIKYVDRPFAGLPFEIDLIAMREFIPAGTLRVKTTAEYGNEELLLVTQLPQLAGALRRKDGVLLVALQTITQSGDASLDIADRIINGLQLNPEASYTQAGDPETTQRLQDVLDLDFPAQLELSDTFAFWVSEAELDDPQIASAIEQSAEAVVPTAKVAEVENAYWVRMQREFIRWIRTEEERAVLNALARLQSRHELSFGDSRFVGAFRAFGLLIPVFELPAGTEAADIALAMKEFEEILVAEIASDAPLTPDEKRAKAGIVSRQLTLR